MFRIRQLKVGATWWILRSASHQVAFANDLATNWAQIRYLSNLMETDDYGTWEVGNTLIEH